MRRFCFALIWMTTIVSGKVIIACTEPINLYNEGMEPKLVITCVLTDTLIEDNFHRVVSENYVVIQKTTPFFGNQFVEQVSGAEVRLDGELLTMTGPGSYSPEDFLAIPGKTYTLEVRYDLNGDGVDEIFTATTTVPPKCHLDSIVLHPLTSRGDYLAGLALYFQGASGENYYGAKLNNKNDSRLFSTRILRYSLFPFDVFSKEGEYQRLMTNWMIQKEMSYDNASKYYVYAGDTLSVTLESLSKEYYRFVDVAKTELSQNNPIFSGPRSNVPTNFTGGALGIFGSYTASSASLQIPPDTQGLPKRPEE